MQEEKFKLLKVALHRTHLLEDILTCIYLNGNLDSVNNRNDFSCF